MFGDLVTKILHAPWWFFTLQFWFPNITITLLTGEYLEWFSYLKIGEYLEYWMV
jgi:hypothetical protein